MSCIKRRLDISTMLERYSTGTGSGRSKSKRSHDIAIEGGVEGRHGI